MNKGEIISAVAYAMVPNGALLLEKDNHCSDEPTIRPLNEGGLILAQAKMFEQFLQVETRNSEQVTSSLFEQIHLQTRLYFWTILDQMPGSNPDFQQTLIGWNKKTITRLKEVAIRLRISYYVAPPPEPFDED